MEPLFITIAEAVRITGESDLAIMRIIKEFLAEPGVNSSQILRKEAKDNGFIYLLNKEILLERLRKTHEEKQSPGQESKEEQKKEERVKEEQTQEEQIQEGQTQEDQTPESSELLAVKNEVIAMLQKALATKDKQIEDLSGKIDQLIERDRETNVLLKTLQDKLFLVEGKRPAESNKKQG